MQARPFLNVALFSNVATRQFGLEEADKRIRIARLPNVLALHLKRFKYVESLGRFKKLAYRVSFPMELSMENVVNDGAAHAGARVVREGERLRAVRHQRAFACPPIVQGSHVVGRAGCSQWRDARR